MLANKYMSQLNKITDGVKIVTGTAISGVEESVHILKVVLMEDVHYFGSRVFLISSHPWIITLSPGGYMEHYSHSVRVYLMLCVYLPTDPQNQGCVDHEFPLVWDEIKSIMNIPQLGGIIFCGDMNTDFHKNKSFVRAVNQFVQESKLSVLWNEFPIDDTYTRDYFNHRPLPFICQYCMLC